MNRKFNLEDIHEFLTRMDLGKWNGFHYSYKQRMAVQTTEEDLDAGPSHELYIDDREHGAYKNFTLCVISNTAFLMQRQGTTEQHDYTRAWMMFLELQEYKRKEAENSTTL